jgi:very-short-patch-repair endonuclease/predicted transcriptional regulator of viral defense system
MGAFDAVRQLAERQHGAITTEQLAACGLSRRQVQRAEERGQLRRVHRGVYLLGSIPLPLTAEAAALLACGPGSVLSHRSAAVLYGMLPPEGGPIHVTTAGGRRPGRTVVSHEGRLHHWEVRERHGLAVTAPTRTLVDLAATCGDEELGRAVSESFAARLTTLPSLRRATQAYRGRRGVARLTVLLNGGPRRTRSAPERALLTAIRDAGLPIPETNVHIGRWEVDFLWREANLVVEVDAYSTHSSPFAFERDRRKDAELRARGLTVQRFTAAQVGADAAAVLAWIAGALSGRRAAAS